MRATVISASKRALGKGVWGDTSHPLPHCYVLTSRGVTVRLPSQNPRQFRAANTKHESALLTITQNKCFAEL